MELGSVTTAMHLVDYEVTAMKNEAKGISRKKCACHNGI